MNKESILNQIKEVENTISLFKELILEDNGNILNSEEGLKKCLQYCNRAIVQLDYIDTELKIERRDIILTNVVKESQEMGLYDDTSNPMIKEELPDDDDEYIPIPPNEQLKEATERYKQDMKILNQYIKPIPEEERLTEDDCKRLFNGIMAERKSLGLGTVEYNLGSKPE